LTPTAVLFQNIDIYDDEGNKGLLDGTLTHNGFFKDMRYHIILNCDNMMAFDIPSSQDALFYGKGYASGDVAINGDEKRVSINCNMTAKPNTNVYIPIDGASKASDDSFITFIDRSEHIDSTQLQEIYAKKAKQQTAQIGLNLLVNITPETNLYLIMDSQSGDIIKASGEGSVRLELDPQTSDFRMYGNCNILEGTYNFTFQNAMRRAFKVIPGGSLVWTGDPATPTMNIDAYYQINASLTDILTSDVLSNVGRSTVPVQCLLNMSGNLTQPELSFDIKLPNSEDELNSALKSAIHSDEEMRRQIIYLLVLGRFQPVNANNGVAQVFGQNELLSVVSTSLSSQLNNWASQLFDNWNFGVNMRSSGEGQDRSMEYELQILYTPNNRITLNGNVGYRNDNMSNSTSNFIGDFDVEYKIVKSGKLSAKAYTHTNDYREFKESLTTQGVGLVYRDNFDSAKGLREEWRTTIENDRRERKANRERRKKKKESRLAAAKNTNKTAVVEEDATN
ncbi:MAG: translocation/assembly module TamB domain-containing protein, partial [Bacteroidales bacterium]|nr:translocation/assembly module TamB domain-containing protein [Bacteroidales bacterium]